MKRLSIVCLAFVLAITFGFANAYAQMSSAKGSAAISNGTVIDFTPETHSWDPIVSTYIKVPQAKELVFDVSLECGLYTDTLVRSKAGTKDTSTAEAAINVHVKLQKILGIDENGDYVLGDAFYAYPGDENFGVTFCKRRQELMAKFQGIFQQCTEYATVIDPYTGEERQECISYGEETCLKVEGIDTDGDGVVDDYITTIDPECLDYEEVQLIQETVSANAFNFVSPNLEQGEYKVTVEAEITSNVDFANGGAEAKGLIGLGSMVVDEVRFIKGDSGLTK